LNRKKFFLSEFYNMKLQELLNTGEGVSIAIVPDGVENDREWNVYVVNTKNEEIRNVMITSNGYGEINNKKMQTSTLRWYFEKMAASSFAMVEPIMEEVFGLSNEYWVSYFANNVLYDKKFIFLPESIQEGNLVTIPVIQKKGILIK
jgi:hypothetical protein